MKVRKSFPPNYKEICKYFPIEGKTNIVFTYGNTLHNKGGGEITPDLFAHEQTHTRQQNEIGIEEWWNRYFTDTQFRLEQELEAYQNQYKYAVEHYNRAERRRLLDRISKDLASPIYGGIITKQEAKELIKN